MLAGLFGSVATAGAIIVDELNDIERTKIKVRRPQTNGICERLHKTIPQEFYQVTSTMQDRTSGENLSTNWSYGSSSRQPLDITIFRLGICRIADSNSASGENVPFDRLIAYSHRRCQVV